MILIKGVIFSCMIFIPGFMRLCHVVQKVLVGDRHRCTHIPDDSVRCDFLYKVKKIGWKK